MKKEEVKRNNEIINELHYSINKFFNKFDSSKTVPTNDKKFISSIHILTGEVEVIEEEGTQEYNMEQYKAEREAEDFFYMVFERANTYLLSDYIVTELNEHVEDDFECERLLTIREEKKKACEKYNVDFHQVSCNIAEQWMKKSTPEDYKHMFGEGK